MLTHKLASLLVWLGLFIAPATTANYNQKPVDIMCKNHNFHVREYNKVMINGAVTLNVKTPDEDFGGFSAALLTKDNHYFYSVTDRARLMRAVPVFDKNRVISCFKNAVFYPLRGNSTRPLVGHYADSEGLSFGTTENDIFVSFERGHRVIKYQLNETQLLPKKNYPPLEIKKLPYNESYESVRILENGDILAVPEYYVPAKQKNIMFYLYSPETDSLKTFFLVSSDGHYITDVNILNNGDFITLERSFSILTGISIQMRHIKRADLFDKNPADGEVIFRMASGEGVDNLEGMAVIHTDNGNYLYVISDDNFTSLQDTIIFSMFYPLKKSGA